MYNISLKLEWDENKRQRTLVDRQMDFADLRDFDWCGCFTREDLRYHYGERRFVSMGNLMGRVVVVGWCKRGDVLRIFSLRKANQREVRRYEETTDR